MRVCHELPYLALRVHLPPDPALRESHEASFEVMILDLSELIRLRIRLTGGLLTSEAKLSDWMSVPAPRYRLCDLKYRMDQDPVG